MTPAIPFAHLARAVVDGADVWVDVGDGVRTVIGAIVWPIVDTGVGFVDGAGASATVPGSR